MFFVCARASEKESSLSIFVRRLWLWLANSCPSQSRLISDVDMAHFSHDEAAADGGDIELLSRSRELRTEDNDAAIAASGNNDNNEVNSSSSSSSGGGGGGGGRLVAQSMAESQARSGLRSVPWGRFLSTPAVWAIFAAHGCNNCCWYLLLSYLPTYLHDELGVSLERTGIYSMFCFLAAFVCMLFNGRLADVLIQRRVMTKLAVRKAWVAIGLYVPGAV